MSVRLSASKRHSRRLLAGLALAASVLAAGCAADGDVSGAGLTTSALPEHPKVDQTCVTLASRIDTLRGEGVTQRVEQASQGKTATVNVKRASLAKVAELDKANAEFQARCGKVPVGQQSAAVATPPVPAAPQAAAAPAAKAVAKSAAKAAAVPSAGAATASQVAPAPAKAN